ncbi:hypothetical protein RND81_08G117000 [Saponaria officinalis]|uniref:Neprosin PEP catalytic domain-containing protein n=1 Tax=Saponaria officinalis TaxID=3572 RepID=A0AAW1J6M4_SAPOF
MFVLNSKYAIVQTKSGPNPPNYYGVGADLSVWNPQVKENQYSASQITIQNGPDSLQVGWMVNPTMYKEGRTHIFIHTNHYLTFVSIMKQETTSGNWWLLATENKIPIGFWPNNIFTTLNKYGTHISCEGETYSPLDQPGGLPPMGSGAYPLNIPEQDAFAANFETADDKLKVINIDGTEKFMDTKKYIVDDLGIIQGSLGHVVFFGGYGG